MSKPRCRMGRQLGIDPNLIVDPVLDYAKIQYDLGYIKKPLTKDEIFDLTFYQKN